MKYRYPPGPELNDIIHDKFKAEKFFHGLIPQYSENITDTFLMVKKFTDKGFGFRCEFRNKMWRARIGRWEAAGETPSHAISLALLKIPDNYLMRGCVNEIYKK